MNWARIGLIIAALFAGLSAVIFERGGDQSQSSQFLGWPKQYQQKTLTQLPLTQQESIFVRGFPGKIARFTDGRRQLVMRWVDQPTHKLHPASDCYKGIGYDITPAPIEFNERGIQMACFEANKGDKKLKVCEFIEAPNGQNWSDVSAWYWGVMTDDQPDGWFSYVIAEAL